METAEAQQETQTKIVEVTRQAEEYATEPSGHNWDQKCNELQVTLGWKKTWALLRALIDPTMTKSENRNILEAEEAGIALAITHQGEEAEILTDSQEECRSVVAPDLRGYGNTTRPEDTAQYLMLNLIEDVKGLLEHLNNNHSRKVFLVGHDWGGMISFCFATLYETFIDGMVIINGMHPMAFAKQLFRSVRQMRMSWYQLPFRHPVVPEQYLIMWDFHFFDKVHRGFTENETEAHKYMFSRDGALTGAISYYRAFNNDSNQLRKLPYQTINVSTLILWAEKDAFIMSPIAKYNQEWLKTSKVVYYRGAGHWLPRECSTQVTEQIRKFASNTTTGTTVTEEATPEHKQGTCQEASFPSRRGWLSKLFPWLPRNARLPKQMRE
ncbi:epoxide hydrolase 2 [Dermacentor silvarum]|uniref:epoxide hydrolase 2 n=1 Tax=Dermacentor silvarum TaxID=543639 RepID=UPI001896AA93|nr:epoxide hydrolase 2 [Dermacentor silvarum]